MLCSSIAPIFVWWIRHPKVFRKSQSSSPQRNGAPHRGFLVWNPQSLCDQRAPGVQDEATNGKNLEENTTVPCCSKSFGTNLLLYHEAIKTNPLSHSYSPVNWGSVHRKFQWYNSPLGTIQSKESETFGSTEMIQIGNKPQKSLRRSGAVEGPEC